MAEISHNSSMRFFCHRNDDLVRRVLFIKLVESGFETDGADRRDIINRMMEPIGAHRWREFVESRRHTHPGLVATD
jgi:hypothetical protein